MMLDRKVSLIGAPLGLGGGHPGTSLGPTGLRMAGLAKRVRALGLEFEDTGDLVVPCPTVEAPPDPRARFVDEIAAHCRELADRVQELLERGRFPLVVGGDHAIACGTVAGLKRHHAARGGRIGLIWFDAHGDMNTPETSPSGNVHGMPLACILGFGPPGLTELAGAVPMVAPRNAVLIGVHELDTHEKELIRSSGMRIYTMREIDRMGMQKVMEEAIDIACDGTVGFHLSFDVDGCDPSVAPGTGTIVPGGTDFRESHMVMENVAGTGRLLSLEVTEVNPILDVRNQTSEFAVGLIQSALGKLIL
jgi:arginase